MDPRQPGRSAILRRGHSLRPRGPFQPPQLYPPGFACIPGARVRLSARRAGTELLQPARLTPPRVLRAQTWRSRSARTPQSLLRPRPGTSLGLDQRGEAHSSPPELWCGAHRASETASSAPERRGNVLTAGLCTALAPTKSLRSSRMF